MPQQFVASRVLQEPYLLIGHIKHSTSVSN